MEDKDRVFARFKDDKPETPDRREMLTIPRRAGAYGSRVVEVVHVRSGGAVKDRPRRVDTHVRAASWEGGFPAKHTAAPPSLPLAPMSPEAAPPITHVMPGWEPAPTVIVEEPTVTTQRSRGRPRKQTSTTPGRRVADPFDAADDGANCMRCGYAIEQDREQRGLLTCARCG